MKTMDRKKALRTKMLKRFHPEGIPWPATILYNAVSRSDIFLRHYELVARDVVRLGPLASVLDVGTGPARLLMALYKLAPDTQLCGVDISAAMMATARRNLERHCPHGNIALSVGSAESLPYPDASFECVVSTGSLHHWKNALTGFNEVHRVLKKGHCALIYDLVGKMPNDVARKVRRRYGSFRMALLWLHSFEEPFLDADELLSLAEQSLFQKVEIGFTGALCCVKLKK